MQLDSGSDGKELNYRPVDVAQCMHGSQKPTHTPHITCPAHDALDHLLAYTTQAEPITHRMRPLHRQQGGLQEVHRLVTDQYVLASVRPV